MQNANSSNDLNVMKIATSSFVGADVVLIVVTFFFRITFQWCSEKKKCVCYCIWLPIFSNDWLLGNGVIRSLVSVAHKERQHLVILTRLRAFPSEIYPPTLFISTWSSLQIKEMIHVTRNLASFTPFLLLNIISKKHPNVSVRFTGNSFAHKRCIFRWQTER